MEPVPLSSVVTSCAWPLSNPLTFLVLEEMTLKKEDFSSPVIFQNGDGYKTSVNSSNIRRFTK